jgi:hypothetical protein
VREGYVSPAVAHNVYGVVLTSSGDVDVVATRLRREAKRPLVWRRFEVTPGQALKLKRRMTSEEVTT